ncbi:uncharacterized protein MONBRDRAFT_26319 [Monosiga brevicollis MX1]|uniref:Prenylcysteine lyase domain-containing protein n=1 Tax=Monosiga brevicollis TaxID=81824 RepID=A9V212_MONBE|nr:uncharacterized protein MONBRDRAFT_26319 [Monosiga brevicollis MX1]EDQ88662.1 predicted protein [Monosiga brevicollis MX1]|eukprot:XP_001746766.1 hypothetical protein [Monosiga brevicollis MX1]
MASVSRRRLRLALVLALALVLGGAGAPIGEREGKRVAIIGAGVAGSATAYFLRHNGRLNLTEEDEPSNLVIDMYDASAELQCGRVRSIDVNGKTVEVGGAVIHNSNYYATTLAKQLGLERTLPAKMLLRYGLSPFRVNHATLGVLHRFSEIYEQHEQGQTFEDIAEFVEMIGAVNLTNTSLRQFLINEGVGETFINEVVAGVMRVNYGQSVDVPAFVGLVSLAGGTDDIWAIEGGNWRLCEGLREASTMTLRTRHTITGLQVAPAAGPKDFRLVWTDDEGNVVSSEKYDAVVIAAGLSEAKLQLPKSVRKKVVETPYHTTVATIVQGQLRDLFDHLACDLPEVLLTTEHEDHPFSSLGRLGSLPATEEMPCPGIYKIFSSQPLGDAELDALFATQLAEPEVRVWKAYPEYGVGQPHSAVELMPGLVYVNAVETVASAIEVSLIGARNAALLVGHHFLAEAEGSYHAAAAATATTAEDEVPVEEAEAAKEPEAAEVEDQVAAAQVSNDEQEAGHDAAHERAKYTEASNKEQHTKVSPEHKKAKPKRAASTEAPPKSKKRTSQHTEL